MSNNFQRAGSTSNAHVGREFEDRVQKALAKHGLSLVSDHKVLCGLHEVRKNHSFDLGSENPKVIVECKTHTWTVSGNVPSAKMQNWAGAMFYFHMAPKDYRKIFIVEHSPRPGKGKSESLLSYFLRTHTHMIPDDVECWELNGGELVNKTQA